MVPWSGQVRLWSSIKLWSRAWKVCGTRYYNAIILWKSLFTDTVSGYKKYVTDTVSGYKKFVTDTVSGYKKYVKDTVSGYEKYVTYTVSVNKKYSFDPFQKGPDYLLGVFNVQALISWEGPAQYYIEWSCIWQRSSTILAGWAGKLSNLSVPDKNFSYINVYI